LALSNRPFYATLQNSKINLTDSQQTRILKAFNRFVKDRRFLAFPRRKQPENAKRKAIQK
jgi:hypothetical protein